MKGLYFILIFTLINFTSFSQNSFKPLDSLSSWQGASIFSTGGYGTVSWVHYYTDSVYTDTTVNSNTYTKLFLEHNPNSGEYFCGFRSDTIENAVYVLPKDSTNEYLFFDFDSIINIGEQFEMTYFNGVNWETAGHQLQEIDSILFEGNYYLSWDFGYPFTITERIMSDKGFPFHGRMIEVLGFSEKRLKCYSEGNLATYGDCPYTSADANQANKISENKNSFQIFPNPFNEVIQINNAKGTELLIYNYLGKLVLSEHISADNYLINTEQFVSGVYLFKIGTTSKTIIKL